MFVGRHEELQDLSLQLRSRHPSLVVVRGAPGIGVTRLLREALASLPHLFFPVPHLPDEAVRELLRRQVEAHASHHGRAGGGTASPTGDPPPASPDWPALLGMATRLAPPPAPDAGPPFTLVLDDAHRLLTRGALPGLLRRTLAGLRPRGIPFHLVLAGTDPLAMSAFAEAAGHPDEEPDLDLELRPFTVSEAAQLLPRWPAMDCMLAWSVLGGNPRRLSRVERRSSVATTIQRLVLDPDGPLHREGSRILERSFQAPARYAAVLAALAGGARSWGAMGEAIPGEMGGARLGPYVKGLEERGFVRVESALDAKPGTRSRRYTIPDPFLRFWFGEVLPLAGRLATSGPAPAWEEEIRPRLAAHVARMFPEAARLWLQHDARDQLGAVAREVGALWGPDHELDVAGLLRNGEAVYGLCRWREEPMGEKDLDDLEGQMRRVRYGIGREGRHRLLFGRGAATPSLRSRVARDAMVRVVGVRELVGER